MKTRWRQLGVVFARWGGRALAVAVVLMTLSVAWAQIAHLAPAVAGDSRAVKGAIVAATLFFLGNVLFNYARCARRGRGGRRRGRAATGGVSRVMAAANHHRRLRASREGRERGRARERAGFEPARGRDDDGAIGDGAFGIRTARSRGASRARRAKPPSRPARTTAPPAASACRRWTTTVRSWRTASARTPCGTSCCSSATSRSVICTVFVCVSRRARTRRARGGGAVAAFLDALGSTQRFRHGWDDAAETTREGTGAVFGSKTLSRFLGPPPAFTAKALFAKRVAARRALTRGTRRVLRRAWGLARGRRGVRRGAGLGRVVGVAALRRRDHLRRDLAFVLGHAPRRRRGRDLRRESQAQTNGIRRRRRDAFRNRRNRRLRFRKRARRERVSETRLF